MGAAFRRDAGRQVRLGSLRGVDDPAVEGSARI
jgi:hypothetical protein